MASKYSMNDRPSWPRRAIVTAGEPYGNKGLHFGHVGGVFVPADFFARFLRDRLGRENVIFTSGTDCYGSPIMESYRKLKENEGYDKSIGEYVESNHSRQAATLNNYNISCDIYGGSGLEPAAQIHNEVTAEIIERLHEQGTISKRSTLQFYDAKAGTFLNGRQVIRPLPHPGLASPRRLMPTSATWVTSLSPRSSSHPRASSPARCPSCARSTTSTSTCRPTSTL